MANLLALARGMPGQSTDVRSPRAGSPAARLPRGLPRKAARRGRPRVLPQRTGPSRHIKPLSIAKDAAESVRLSDLTEAELRSVRPRTLQAYGKYDAQFRAWRRRTALGGEWDSDLLVFVTEKLTVGAPTSEIEGIVSAVTFFRSTSLKHFPRLQRAVRGVRCTRPHRSRIPLAEELVAAIAAILIMWGLRPLALLVVLAMTCYLRPGEVQSLRAEDILAPTAGRAVMLRHWSVFLRPEERMEPTKTGTFDETIYIDHPPGLGPALGSYRQQLRPHDALFPFPPELIASGWRAACRAAGAPGSVMYQLRHAGASGDLLAQRRSMMLVQSRGRWQSAKNCRRYAKSGQVQRSLSKLSKPQLALGTAALQHMEGLLMGSWKPPTDLVPAAPSHVSRCQRDLNTCIMKLRNSVGPVRRRLPSQDSYMPGRKRARK